MWCRSAHTHRFDAALNNSLRLVSGCIRATLTVVLPVVSGIMSPDICRNQHCLALSRRAEADDHHSLHDIVTASARTKSTQLNAFDMSRLHRLESVKWYHHVGPYETDPIRQQTKQRPVSNTLTQRRLRWFVDCAGSVTCSVFHPNMKS